MNGEDRSLNYIMDVLLCLPWKLQMSQREGIFFIFLGYQFYKVYLHKTAQCFLKPQVTYASYCMYERAFLLSAIILYI